MSVKIKGSCGFVLDTQQHFMLFAINHCKNYKVTVIGYSELV